MIAHDPSLVILSIVIAILGAFAASVLTSDIGALSWNEGRMRLVLAAVTLGGSIWAAQFIGLLAIAVPVNFTYDVRALALSAAAAFAGTAVALFLLWPKHGDAFARLPAAVPVFGIAIAAANYLGIVSIAGRGLQLSWFLTAICIAFSLQVR